MVDTNDDGVIDADEYRFSCITKFAIDDVEVVDEAFNNMLSVRKNGAAVQLGLELWVIVPGRRQEARGHHSVPIPRIVCRVSGQPPRNARGLSVRATIRVFLRIRSCWITGL